MIFHITLINNEGIMLEHTLDLPISDEATYSEFEALSEVKDLLLMNPTMRIQDVTPDGMPASFTDAEQQSRQLANCGIKMIREPNKQTVYEDIE